MNNCAEKKCFYELKQENLCFRITPPSLVLCKNGIEREIFLCEEKPRETERFCFAGEGFRVELSFRDEEESLRISCSLENLTGETVDLCELRSFDAEILTEGARSDWLLGTIGQSCRTGTLAERLESVNEINRRMMEGYGQLDLFHPDPTPEASDGRFRKFTDFASLYDRAGRGILLAAGGIPEAFLQITFFVDEDRTFCRVSSEENGRLLRAGERIFGQEVLLLQGNYDLAVDRVMRELARTHGARTGASPCGWCSWYDRYADISEYSILSTVEGIRKAGLSLDFIQIDDGYQRDVGDWRPNQKFPQGFGEIVNQIRTAGAQPGIWIAPLIVHADSDAGRRFEGVLQRDRQGNLLGDMGNWGGVSRPMDPTHPQVKRFLREVIREKIAEGFTYFKFDFNVLNEHCVFWDRSKTRLQVMRELFSLYREELGDCYLLACVGSFTRGAVGYADAVRTGPDSGPVWKAAHICSIYECIRAVGNSASANGVLHVCDPDVIYLPAPVSRGICGGLTVEELRTWHGFVGMLGGLNAFSEPVERPEFAEFLELARTLIPAAHRKGRDLSGARDADHKRFGYDGEQLGVAFRNMLVWNPGENEVSLNPKDVLGESDFWIYSFWENRVYRREEAEAVFSGIAPHGSRLLRLTPDVAFAVLGSDLHISMGDEEVAAASVSEGILMLSLKRFGRRNGTIYLLSRETLISVRCERPCRLVRMNEVLYRIEVDSR